MNKSGEVIQWRKKKYQRNEKKISINKKQHYDNLKIVEQQQEITGKRRIRSSTDDKRNEQARVQYPKDNTNQRTHK